METYWSSPNAVQSSQSFRMSKVKIASKEQPFITYKRSAEEAVKDLDQTASIRNFSDKIFRCQDTKDLKAILKSHVKQKKGEEAIFIRDLGFMYALTKLLTSIGFPKDVRDSMKTFRQFYTVRGFIKLKYEYHVDTYEHETFSSQPGSGSEDAIQSEEQVERRKELSMQLGMLFGVLDEFDRFKDMVRSRLLALGSSAKMLTALEQQQLRQYYDDCYYLTRGLLGGLAQRIDSELSMHS